MDNLVHPQKLVSTLVHAIEEAEQVAGSTGAQKKAFVVEAVRAVATHTMSVDDAALVEVLAPHLIDALVAATKGLLGVNEKEGEPSPRCCTLL